MYNCTSRSPRQNAEERNECIRKENGRVSFLRILEAALATTTKADSKALTEVRDSCVTHCFWELLRESEQPKGNTTCIALTSWSANNILAKGWLIAVESSPKPHLTESQSGYKGIAQHKRIARVSIRFSLLLI